MRIALWLHLTGVIVWVGGMFFTMLALRPAVQRLTEPAMRLTLLQGVLARFLPWVLACVVLILGSGMHLVGVRGGWQAVGAAVYWMVGLGLLMMAIFGHLYAAPYRRLRRAVDRADWPAAAREMSFIRTAIAINLALGLVVVAIATLGVPR